MTVPPFEFLDDGRLAVSIDTARELAPWLGELQRVGSSQGVPALASLAWHLGQLVQRSSGSGTIRAPGSPKRPQSRLMSTRQIAELLGCTDRNVRARAVRGTLADALPGVCNIDQSGRSWVIEVETT